MSIKSRLGFLQAAIRTGDRNHLPITYDYTLAHRLGDWTQSDMPDLPATEAALKSFREELIGTKNHLICLKLRDWKVAADDPAQIENMLRDVLYKFPGQFDFLIGREMNWTRVGEEIVQTDPELYAKVYHQFKISLQALRLGVRVYHTNLGAAERAETWDWYNRFLSALPTWGGGYRAALSWLGSGLRHSLEISDGIGRMKAAQIATFGRTWPFIVAELGAPGPYAVIPMRDRLHVLRTCEQQAADLIIMVNAALAAGAQTVFFAPGLQDAPAPSPAWDGWGMVDHAGQITDTYRYMDNFING